METYPFEVEEGMRRFYHSLNEKDRRRFAGGEALRFGPGGRSYMVQVLGCSRNTISKGAREVSDLPTREVEQRIRVKGGGRKRYSVTWGLLKDVRRDAAKYLRRYFVGSVRRRFPGSSSG
jgi:hypothetical protein